jgi:hypothetical protein
MLDLLIQIWNISFATFVHWSSKYKFNSNLTDHCQIYIEGSENLSLGLLLKHFQNLGYASNNQWSYSYAFHLFQFEFENLSVV